jgi:hypothetical protein
MTDRIRVSYGILCKVLTDAERVGIRRAFLEKLRRGNGHAHRRSY